MEKLTWRKSSYSGANGGDCVEIAALGSGVGLRDSKNPEHPHLAVGVREWRDFIRSVRNGDFDHGLR